MTGAADLARLAGLLADETRAAFCLALLDGRAWTAGELAAVAGVAPSTASEQLSRLIAGGLLTERRQGRHRYVQLAGPDVAALLEELTARLDPPRPKVRSLRASSAAAALARGRTCYDHLAGRLGVAVTDAMTGRALLDQTAGCALTPAGVAWLTGELGVDPDLLRGGGRSVARPCLDWTERRTHLAGAAGAQICAAFFARGWIERIGSTRAVRPTAAGTTALRAHLGIEAGAEAGIAAGGGRDSG